MRKFYSALKIVCYIALGVSLLALAAIVIHVLTNGAEKLSFRLLFGQYKSAAPPYSPRLSARCNLC